MPKSSTTTPTQVAAADDSDDLDVNADELFAMLSPEFLEFKCLEFKSGKFEPDETSQLARMFTDVTHGGIAEAQRESALHLAQALIREYSRQLDAALNYTPPSTAELKDAKKRAITAEAELARLREVATGNIAAAKKAEDELFAARRDASEAKNRADLAEARAKSLRSRRVEDHPDAAAAAAESARLAEAARDAASKLDDAEARARDAEEKNVRLERELDASRVALAAAEDAAKRASAVSPSKRTTEEESLAVETSVALAAAEEATRVAEEERSREAARASAAARARRDGARARGRDDQGVNGRERRGGEDAS